MKRKIPILVLFTITLLILLGCSPATPAPTQTSIPTNTPIPTLQPTNTPTPTPLPGKETISLSSLAMSIPWLAYDSKAIPTIYYYGFSMTIKPFHDAKVRQAFAAAVDRQAIADLAKKLGARDPQPATTYIPSETLGRELFGEVGIQFDPQKAKQLLTDAGYPDGKGFPSVTLVTLRSGGITSVYNTQLANTVIQMWKQYLKVDVKLDVVPPDWNLFIARTKTYVKDGKPFIYRMGNAADYNDPDSFVKALVTGNEFNVGDFENADFDNLVNRGKEVNDPGERQQIYIQAELIINEEMVAVIPLFHFETKS